MQLAFRSTPTSLDTENTLREVLELERSELIRNHSVDIVLVKRQMSKSVMDDADGRCAFGPVFEWKYQFDSTRMEPKKIESAFAQLHKGPLRTQIVADIQTLARHWSHLTGRREVRAVVGLADTDRCSKLHSDYIDLRILCTYAGPGTWLAPEHAIDRNAFVATGDSQTANMQICPDPSLLIQASEGDVVFLKGQKWNERARGAVHRSPSLIRTGKRRVLLTIDGMVSGL